MTIVHFCILCAGIFGAFFFAGIETGFVSWNPLKIGYRARRGDFKAQWALYLIRHKERVLSTLLIGNNACVVGASISFMYLFARFDAMLQWDLGVIPSPESWFLSPVLVVFSEMLPKSLFRIYSFRLTLRFIPLLMILYWLFLPFTWIFSSLGALFQRKLVRGKSFITNVRKEMVLVAEEGSRRGTLFEYAVMFIDNILNLKGKTIEDILKRYHETAQAQNNNEKRIAQSDIISTICNKYYLPDDDNVLVYDDARQQVVGWLSILDIAKAGGNVVIASIMHPIPRINAGTSLLTCFSNRINFHYPFYRIVGEKGVTIGILNRFTMFRLIFEGYSSM